MSVPETEISSSRGSPKRTERTAEISGMFAVEPSMRGMFSLVNLKTSGVGAGAAVGVGDTEGVTVGEAVGTGSEVGDTLGAAVGAGFPELQAEKAVTMTAQAKRINTIRFILVTFFPINLVAHVIVKRHFYNPIAVFCHKSRLGTCTHQIASFEGLNRKISSGQQAIAVLVVDLHP